MNCCCFSKENLEPNTPNNSSMETDSTESFSPVSSKISIEEAMEANRYQSAIKQFYTNSPRSNDRDLNKRGRVILVKAEEESLVNVINYVYTDKNGKKSDLQLRIHE